MPVPGAKFMLKLNLDNGEEAFVAHRLHRKKSRRVARCLSDTRFQGIALRL
ncbi:Hypothetical protein DEACI_1104 [Acididesulfobacillus acetoxydans]|uniref:Uncharacterized protein n=1 Tax=Acididesulfobacillus acetoxydans TaxID=1561005 RepID=A0A8S0WWQ7_9FIRM|nr:Hypothetical protein DEACI_1104 [Acididesulfobacillus acetoxydans]CEJ06585.1 Hypothetical protein DEACI_1034 [Acididesulfobacillus acetoxydans]